MAEDTQQLCIIIILGIKYPRASHFVHVWSTECLNSIDEVAMYEFNYCLQDIWTLSAMYVWLEIPPLSPGSLHFPWTWLMLIQILLIVLTSTTSLVGGGISLSVTVMWLNPATPLMTLLPTDTSMSTLSLLGVMWRVLGMEYQVNHLEVIHKLNKSWLELSMSWPLLESKTIESEI